MNNHIFEILSHEILFKNTSLGSIDLEIKQVVREAIEIKLKQNSNISLNRDFGEYSLNALGTNLIKNEFTDYIKKIANIDEPVTRRLLGKLLFSSLSAESAAYFQSWLKLAEVMVLG